MRQSLRKDRTEDAQEKKAVLVQEREEDGIKIVHSLIQPEKSGFLEKHRAF
jgi:hypothetical protein